MKEIAPNIFAATEYPGVNTGFIVVSGGAIAMDAPTLPQDARAWRQQIVETAGGPVLYVVLTDAHPDRLLCARLLEAPIVAVRAAYERAATYTDGFWRGVVEGWVRRYPEAAADLAEATVALPEVVFTARLTLHKGEAGVMVEHIAGGAPGSAWVYLREQNVLFAGDTLVVKAHPFLEATLDTGAWLSTLKSLRRARFAKTTIVPGRGPLCDQAATRPLSNYIALARRRARSLRTARRARVDKAAVVAELMDLFPVSEDERDAVQRRIRAGLDRLCEELRQD